MGYSIATIWSEFSIVRMREGGRMASESLLMQSMLSAWVSGKGEAYNKQLGKIRNGR